MSEIGGAYTAGTSFYRFLLILFKFCSNIAMNNVYQFAKVCAPLLSKYVTLCGKEGEHILLLRVLISLSSFFFCSNIASN